MVRRPTVVCDRSFCTSCGSIDTYETKNRKPMPYRCRNCGEYFSVKKGPVMESSRSGHQKYDILACDLAPGDVIAFDFRTLHGTTAGRVEGRQRALSTRWLGDDVTYCRRPGQTSPPFPEIGLEEGERMREDWFPVVGQKDGGPDGSPPA